MSDLFSLPFVDDKYGCSRAGAEHALPNAGTQLARVYAALQECPRTDRMLVEATGLPLNIVNARRWQLVENGLVTQDGTVLGEHGVRNTLWVVVK